MSAAAVKNGLQLGFAGSCIQQIYNVSLAFVVDTVNEFRRAFLYVHWQRGKIINIRRHDCVSKFVSNRPGRIQRAVFAVRVNVLVVLHVHD